MTFSREASLNLVSSMGKKCSPFRGHKPAFWVVRSPMSSVLIVNEISTEREEMTRALEAEGFTVVQAASAAEAVREIWGGSFLVAVMIGCDG